MASTAPPDIPRDPAAYQPTHHFAARFNDRYDEHNRHLDGEIVKRAIREGELTMDTPHRAFFRTTVGGVTYRLVANPTNRAIVTGYPIGINTEAAAASGRWSRRQIEDIREFLASD